MVLRRTSKATVLVKMSPNRAHLSSHMIAVILTIASLLFVPTMGGCVYIYNTMHRTDGFKRYQTGPAQRCYSFSCWNGEVSYITWQRMQETSWIVFYKEPKCTGASVTRWGRGGTLILSDVGMGNSVSPMMVWESTMYATRGMVDLCPQESSPFTNPATWNISEGSENTTSIDDEFELVATVHSAN